MSDTGNSNDEYSSSRVAIPQIQAPDPSRLQAALLNMQKTFDLTDDQIAALPLFDRVFLTPQQDSHLIYGGVRNTHAFGLYVGQKKWSFDGEKGRDHVFAYLFENRKRKEMTIVLNNGSRDRGRWHLFDSKYFGEVSDIIFPFNGSVTSERRITVAKYNFMLGHAAGLYDEDPCFKWTKGFQNQLHAACKDLIDGNAQDGEVGHADKASAATAPFHARPPQGDIHPNAGFSSLITHSIIEPQPRVQRKDESHSEKKVETSPGRSERDIQNPRDSRSGQYSPCPSPKTPVQPHSSLGNLAKYQFYPPKIRLTETSRRSGTLTESQFDSPSPTAPPMDPSSPTAQSPGSEATGALSVIECATLEEAYGALHAVRDQVTRNMAKIEQELGPERYAAVISGLRTQ